MAEINLLSINPHQVSRDMRGYSVFFYGDAKSGKTTTATKFPNHLLLGFEKGWNAMPAGKTGAAGGRGEPCDSLRRKVSSGAPDDGFPQHAGDVSGAAAGRFPYAGWFAPGTGAGIDGSGNPSTGPVNLAYLSVSAKRESVFDGQKTTITVILHKKHKRFCNKTSKGTCKMRKSCV